MGILSDREHLRSSLVAVLQTDQVLEHSEWLAVVATSVFQSWDKARSGKDETSKNPDGPYLAVFIEVVGVNKVTPVK